MDNTDIFSQKAEGYAKYRPSYPVELIDYIGTFIGLKSVCADIGAGTGLFTKCLCRLGCEIIAVEPNMNMLSQATEILKNYEKITFVKSPAEDTMLAEKSIDLITVAQAFHWFDADKFKAECKRILKADGQVLLVWNTFPKGSDFVTELYEINTRLCEDFSKTLNKNDVAKDDKILNSFFDSYETMCYDNYLTYDKEKFIGTCLSKSYTPKEHEEGFSTYIETLGEFFDKYAKGLEITLPNITKCYIGKI